MISAFAPEGRRVPLARALLLFAAFVLSSSARADLQVPAIFSDHAVLQRGREVPVWGWAAPGEEVKVTLGSASASGKAGEDGKWLVRLPLMEAGGPHTLAIEAASGKKASFSDVLVGEVWLCSGQSNMEWTVGGVDNAAAEIAAGDHPRVRHIKLDHVPSDKPVTKVPSSGWRVASPQTVGDFTAVGYFFALALEKELGVPIGLIGSNWGGTRIEPWIPPEGFKAVPALADIANRLDSFPEKNADGSINFQTALALYNGMIHPLIPYGIRGALWYQGESNNGEGMLYHEKMKALIEGWRRVWGDESLAFYYVQLAPFRYGGDPTSLAGIWEAQLKTLAIPHTGMAVTVDIGNVTDIHPRNKQDVGKRLALWALAKDYGKEVVYSGPLYKSMKVEGGWARVRFDHAGSGLVSRDGKPLTGFEVAGKDGAFKPARAYIDGPSLVVWADEVKEPSAVRFGWNQEAEPNLSNKEGLPASPFRTE